MLGGEGGGRVETHDGGAEPVVGPSSSGATSMMAGIGEEEKGAGGSDGGGGVEFFEGERSGGGGNRWPRQETLALLKIRSEMDVVFRDSSLKGPLWEQVSRKMAELGYHRGAKKCKEKFENVYKYHKRTKDGRVGKSDGKTYRFFDQLEALEHHHASSASASQPPLPPPPRAHEDAVPVTMVMPAGSTITVPSSSHPITVIHAPVVHQRVNPTHQIQQPQPQQQQQQTMSVQSGPVQMEQPVPLSPSATQSSSSSTSSDEEVMGGRKRKRKWKDYFERLMREVIDKQEELQKRFLEAVEKREHDRAAREEAWKMQEIARLNREHEILVQERSMAAAKDAALISFLQKLSEQQQISLPLPVQIQTQIQTQSLVTTPVVTTTNTSQSQSQPQPQPKTPVPVSLPQMAQPLAQVPPTQPPPPPPPQQAMVATTTNVDRHKANSGDDQNPLTPVAGASSSRWPKAEVETLINLRTSLDQKYQDSGPKGPLWEEISEGMKKLGYNRNAKRCKEKWENINKYFKKVKESSKKRPEDSKTCPYFHQLDALYREKNKGETATTTSTSASYQPTANANMASVGPIPAHPEQQWPAQLGDPESEDDDDDDDDDDDQGNGRFEIVPNNAAASSVNTTTTTTRAATE